METEDVLGALDGNFVIADVFDLFDIEVDLGSQFVLDGERNQIGNFADSMVSRRNIEDARKSLAGLNGADVSQRRIFNAQDRPPDGRIVHPDHAIFHGAFEHSINDEVQPHPRAVAGNGPLAQRNHRELLVRELHRRLLAL